MPEVFVSGEIAKIHYTNIVAFNLPAIGAIVVNEHAPSLPVAYKSWRVVAFGFICASDGLGENDPEVEFGTELGDLGTDADGFGSIIQDSAAGKHFQDGDVYLHDPLKFLCPADPLAGGGTPTVTTGPMFLVWQQKATTIVCNRPNDHDFYVIPIVCIEIRR